MKIAILTLPLHTNYGGILQAYALQTVLQRMGHEVEVLQAPAIRKRHPMLKSLAYGKRLARKLLKDWNTPILYEKKIKREQMVIRQNTNRFISSYINLRNINSLKDVDPSDYDAIVVGSDQIWRKLYFKMFWKSSLCDAFLGFTKEWNIRRISYAASFGMDNISEYDECEIKECREAIREFDAVSVREDSGVKICTDYLAKEAINVLDPTLLLAMEDYVEIVDKSNVPYSQGNMLCYILDSSDFKTNVISTVVKEKGLIPFNVFSDISNHSLPAEERIQPPVESWLRGFMDAKFVVTDSFHACVFSIIFGKPFLAIGNSLRGMSRFTSLLSTFSLNDRLILSESDLLKIPTLLHTPLPKNLCAHKESSLSFLRDSLS